MKKHSMLFGLMLGLFLQPTLAQQKKTTKAPAKKEVAVKLLTVQFR